MPFPASGQAPPSAREQLVWHWFGACTSSDSLILEFHVDGKLVYSSVFPICHVRRSDIKPEPQQRLLTFRFDAAPRRFGTQYRASEPEPITGNVWEAGPRRTRIALGVSFATAERVLLNTRHVARPDSPARSEWIRGLELITRPVRRAERTPPNKRLKLTGADHSKGSGRVAVDDPGALRHCAGRDLSEIRCCQRGSRLTPARPTGPPGGRAGARHLGLPRPHRYAVLQPVLTTCHPGGAPRLHNTRLKLAAHVN